MTVKLSVDRNIARIELDRPNDGNALDLLTAAELGTAVDTIGSSDAQVVLLSSSGPLFCAGGDVRAMAAAPDRQAFVLELASAVHDALVRLRAIPVPVVAAVHATAAGAGLGLVLAADIVVAADTASFLSAYDRVALSPDCGVSALLPSVIGVRRAAQVLLAGQVLDARTALEWGLVSEVCAAEELMPRAEAVVDQLARVPGSALGETARLIRASADRTYADQLDDEGKTIASLAGGEVAGARIENFAKREK